MLPCGPLGAGHGVGVQRVADGQVPLTGEGEDGQHRAVGGPAHTKKLRSQRHLVLKPHISDRRALILQAGSPSSQGYCCQYTLRSKVAPETEIGNRFVLYFNCLGQEYKAKF